ncbi:MAG TPA: DNA polymerase III subunit alpha [Candidatus Saccharimonadales bacterium]|nr:DNA polymerase III subunit alpha [Candidatus Saccharimonadales bacterium]
MSQESAAVPAEPAASKTKFVHLHNHSHYSLLDGLQKVPQMVNRVAELGMDAVALTDHGTLSGALEFYNVAKKKGIKPIIGLEAYVAPRRMHDKTGKIDANPYHLILLAKSYQGYQNLMRLSSEAHLNGFYYKPRVDRELLAELHEGIIALSGCASGEVARHILNGATKEAQETIEWYHQTFGEGNYYLELQDHEEWEPQVRINKGLVDLSKTTGVPLVVTADSHYTHRDDREAHEVLLCVQTGKTIGDTDRMEMDMALFISSPEEVMERWKQHPEAIANAVKIADQCNVELELDQILIPTFPTPDGKSEHDYLHELCWQGAMWRYGDIPKEDMHLQTEAKARKGLPPEIVERLEYELGVISKMGYEGYFLIVADFINWGKNQGIIFGPGRGSAAGSIVSFVMNVTDLDPLEYDLLFERFLNPDRISMPDIDIDIQDTRRGEVIDYVTEKYGQDRVAQIITFGTMAARNAVRDTGRALGMSYAEVDTIAKKIPAPVQGRHIPLAKSIKDDPELRGEYTDNPRAKNLIDLAMKLEGTIRSNGVHAAGVVIAADDIVKFTPLQRAQKGGICTQYSMGPIEQLGLLKMDFLGLSNLTIINNALRIIRRVYNKNINIADIPLDDPKTYELFSRGDTTGIFQFESAGMKRYLRGLKPTKFDDLIAMNALYRPGPMQWIEEFIDRKHGRKKVEYLHPAMKAALEPTYGVMVYQEQVMQISKEVCGFTGGQADSLRKAVAKKKPAEMAKMKKDFIEGAIKTVGADRKMMEGFWESLEAFAAYCFPKSHAACYALIAAWTAYLKANYPSAFMAALMTSNYDNADKISMEIAECKRMGINVLPPDVNESFLEFGVVPGTKNIRFGMAAIKNVGVGAIEAIVAAREAGEPFASAEDFAKRVSAAECNRKTWEALIKSGAMDSFGERSQLLHNLDIITSYASKAQKNALSGQIDIFGSMGVEDDLPGLRLELPSQVATAREQLVWERELLGLYLSRHPLDDYEGYLNDNAIPIAAITLSHEGQVAKIGGMITTVRKITTKSGSQMAFVGLEDKSGSLELIVFPKAYEKNPQLWEADSVMMVTGKINTRDREGRQDGEIKLMVDDATALEYEKLKDYKQKKPTRPLPAAAEEEVAPAEPDASAVTSADLRTTDPLTIQLTGQATTAVLTDIKAALEASPGASPVILFMPGDPPKKIRLPFTVTVTPELQSQVQTIIRTKV